MLDKLSCKITRYLIAQDVVAQANYAYYCYGFQLILSSAFTSVLILIFSLLLHQLPISLCFGVSFFLLRAYSGGYHCKTFGRCVCTSVGIYFAMLAAVYLLDQVHWLFFFQAAPLLLIPFLWRRAPLANPADPPSPQQARRCKRRSRQISACCGALLVLNLFVFHTVELASIAFSIFATVIMMVLEERNYEKAASRPSGPSGQKQR